MQKPSSFPNLPVIDRTGSPLSQPPLRLVTYLDISSFKTNPCTIKIQHNHKQCQFFHYPKDRKRPGDFYSIDLCPYVEQEKELCPFGDNCLKAHSRVEQLYSPLKYKSRFCSFYPNNLQNCEYGDYCSFAHMEQEIAVPLIHHYEFDADFFIFHYKTVMCPFNQNKHDKSSCVYAHNWQDFRRKPQEIRYEPVPCQNWKTGDFVTNYEDGCVNGFDCNKCHGWKEYDFHPMNWMTKPCPKGKGCNKKRECTFYHNASEKREILQNVQFKIFRFVPRNRILKNCFKPNDSFTINNNSPSDTSGTTINLTTPHNINNITNMSNSGWSTKIQLNPPNTLCFNDPDTIHDPRGNSSFQYDYDQMNTNSNFNNNQQINHPMGFSWSKSPLNNNGNNNSNTLLGSFPMMDPSFANMDGTTRMNFSSRSDNNNYYNNNNNNLFNANSGTNSNNSGNNNEGQQKKTFHLSKSSDFYPSLSTPNYANSLDSFNYPAKIDPWKQQGFLPEPIEEKENDGNITPNSIKITRADLNSFANDSDNNEISPKEISFASLNLKKKESGENFLSNLPPPYQISKKKRDVVEKSRFVGNFAKEEPNQDELFKALNDLEKFSIQKK